MLDDAQSTRWPAMAEDLVQHYVVLWHASDTRANVAGRCGPYEHYRLVYRYGYDLGVDERFRCAAWLEVEQVARPRWEERNPGTWGEFKETICYAWDISRGRC